MQDESYGAMRLGEKNEHSASVDTHGNVAITVSWAGIYGPGEEAWMLLSFSDVENLYHAAKAAHDVAGDG